jgi:thioredoxin
MEYTTAVSHKYEVNKRMKEHVIEANQANFQIEVIQKSHQQPVIVDFWAPWCGPCHMLGPILERLTAEYNGRFRLAKINSDNNPQLSMQFNVRGIPAVKAFVNGRVVDEFVGAQPDPLVRQFIERVLAQKPAGTAKPAAKKATAVPNTPQARLQKAKELLRQGNGCEAVKMLPDGDKGEAEQLRPLAQYLCDVSHSRLAGANIQIANMIQRREYAGAMYGLLMEINGGNGRARPVIDGLFTLLGDNDPTVKAYKQQLAVA